MGQRVLFTASTYGHIRSFHLPYLRAFRELGWEVHVACGGTAGDLPEADRTVDVPFEKKMTSPANLRATAALRKLIMEAQYDLIVTHTSLAAFFTRLAVKGLNKRPIVINMAHGYLFDDNTSSAKRALLLGAEKLTAGETDLLLTMNDYDFALAQKQQLGKRIATVPGIGVNFAAMDVPPASRADFDLADEDFILLYAAEFSGRKNQAMLIRALPALPERVKLLLPGRGDKLEECRTLAETLGVSHRVVFPGFVSPMAPLYGMADCAVSSSRSEGLPFNIMEAMYAGLPVVASCVKGHTDLIEVGVTGLLYPYDDEAAFAEDIRRALEDSAFAASLGAAAHEAVLPYGLDVVLPQVMEHYLSLTPAAVPADAR